MTDGYSALRHSAAWLDLDGRGRIVARGRDRARLLHNLSSNEVKKMVPGDSCYAFLLNPQGRIQADLQLVCLAEHFLIDTEPELRDKVLQHIRRYIIGDQVELEDVSSQMASIGVEGPQAGSAPPFEISGDIVVAPFSVTGQPGYRMYCPVAAKAELVARLESLGVRPATADDARIVRIENGKPRYGEDIRETSLPQETQQMQAVSFNKGCYLGQDIVERIRALGQVHKKLQRIELEGSEPPPSGTKLRIAAGEAEITSAVYSEDLGKVIALAYVRAA
jgi:tRNA-modifying protein YgfZ